MAKLPHSNSRRMYSWWWDSHISPKNSRWLQENLTDMDVKVKSMIKLIEEDADSFARRAEMYYKKRPELMKMVEEFYRAYRALAERYDQSTRALLQASRTMTESFPNQVPSGLTEDELAKFANENYPQATDDQYSEQKKGLKQFNDSGSRERVRKGLNFDEAEEKEDKSNKNTVKLEKEIQTLKEALAKFEAEKESSLAHRELEIIKVKEDEMASLKIALKNLEVEKGTTLAQYQKCLEKIEVMEGIISHAEKHILDLNERSKKVEDEAQTLKLNLATMESEKATFFNQCKQSLEKISSLENKLVLSEEEAKKLNERAEEAEAEAEAEAEILKKSVGELGIEREANAVKYQQCLHTISTLETKILCAEEEVHILNGEIEIGNAKLKDAEEKCILLENSNKFLHSEFESLKLKMEVQSEELKEKEGEMGILWTSVQEERFRFVEAETAFHTLQILHAQTVEELKFNVLELQKKSVVVSDLETRNRSLLNDLLKIKDESESLNDLNSKYLLSIENMQNEIKSVLESKRKLEEEVELRVDQRNALQQDIYCLKEELNDLNKNYFTILDKVEGLQDENLNLKEIQEKEMREKLDLLGKVENLENVLGKNAFLEKSLFDLHAELEGARKEILELGKSFKSVSEEKSTLDLEKAAIVTQLTMATENLVKLSETNTFMEHSISDAHDEIEGQKIRLNSLEISCQTLENEKLNLVNEKVSLVSQVEITRQILEDLEKKYQGLEEKYSVLEKEKESALSEVVELQLTVKESKQKEENQMIEIEDLHGKFLDMQKTSVTLREENSKLLDEKLSLVNTFQTLQFLHAQTEGELKFVALELQNRSLIVSDLEIRNQSLLNESSKIKEENENLNELNLTSMLSIKNMQNEIISLLETKGQLEEEVELRLNQTNALQQDISCLKKTLDDLNKKYLAMFDQVEAVGFNPECFESAVKSLQNENLILKEIQEKEMREKLDLLGKIQNLEKVVEKNALLEKSLSDLREDLEGARKEILALEKSFIFVSEEKSTLGLEKAAIVTQLQVATENLMKLSEKNTFMKNSLSDAHGEIEGLNINFKRLEESCQTLENEKTDLIGEKVTLVSQVEINKQRSEDLEKKFRGLEEKYSVLEKEKESALCKVVELQSILEEKKHKEEKQMIEIEDLQREFLDMQKTSVTLTEENSKLINEKISLVNAFQNLQGLHDLTEKKLKSVTLELQNRSLIVSELETHNQSLQHENLNLKEIQEKEMREKLDLLGKVEILESVVEKNALLEKSLSDSSADLEGARKEILALGKSFVFVSEEKSALGLEKAAIVTQLRVATENLIKLADKNTFMENSVSDAHDEIEGLKKILQSFEESCQNLENEKSDLINEKISLVSQVEITRQVLEDLEKKYLGLEEKYSVLEKEKQSTVYEVVELQLTVTESKQKEEKQMIEIEDLHVKVLNMQKTRDNLTVENSKLLDEKISLVNNVGDLQEKNNTLEGGNLLILDETAYLSCLSVIFKNIINEKSREIEELLSTVEKIQHVSVGFEEKVSVMEGKLEQAQLENMDLNTLLKKTEDNLSAITVVNGQLNLEIENMKDLLCQKETEISEEKCKIADIEKEKSELQNFVAKLKEKNGEIKMFLDEANRERNDDVVFWESEAAKLVSELHTSYVIRASLEEKFQELTGVLKSLEEESYSKDKGIELLTEMISFLENENEEIEARLAAFSPVINSLKDCISSLEYRTSLHKELQNEKQENMKVEVESHEGSDMDQKDSDKLSDLQDIETRVKAVEITIIEIISKLETATRQLEELGSQSSWNQEKTKPSPVDSESEQEVWTNDIMLDQISESSSYETGKNECITADIADLNGNEKIIRRNGKEVDFDSGVTVGKELGVGKLAISNRFSLPNQDLDKTKILQRLNSDSQKLSNLQTTVQDLKRKVEMSEKRIEGKSFGSQSVEEQLVKAEEDIMHLADANGKLIENVDNSDDVKSVVESEENRNLRRKFSEQARKVSERIGQLQLEVQKIQFCMLKIDGENSKDKIKRKSEITGTKRRTSLRDYLGLRSSNRKRKRSFCGCVHPPSTAD